MANTTTSKQFTLNWSDIVRGLVVAVITPIITILTSSLNAGSLTFDWKAIGFTALAAAGAYLTKNLLTPAKIVVTDASKELVEEVKKGISQVVVTKK